MCVAGQQPGPCSLVGVCVPAQVQAQAHKQTDTVRRRRRQAGRLAGCRSSDNAGGGQRAAVVVRRRAACRSSGEPRSSPARTCAGQRRRSLSRSAASPPPRDRRAGAIQERSGSTVVWGRRCDGVVGLGQSPQALSPRAGIEPCDLRDAPCGPAMGPAAGALARIPLLRVSLLRVTPACCPLSARAPPTSAASQPRGEAEVPNKLSAGVHVCRSGRGPLRGRGSGGAFGAGIAIELIVRGWTVMHGREVVVVVLCPPQTLRHGSGRCARGREWKGPRLQEQ